LHTYLGLFKKVISNNNLFIFEIKFLQTFKKIKNKWGYYP
jgi:hypothetical protein